MLENPFGFETHFNWCPGIGLQALHFEVNLLEQEYTQKGGTIVHDSALQSVSSTPFNASGLLPRLRGQRRILEENLPLH